MLSALYVDLVNYVKSAVRQKIDAPHGKEVEELIKVVICNDMDKVHLSNLGRTRYRI
jgi:hypothetical protein